MNPAYSSVRRLAELFRTDEGARRERLVMIYRVYNGYFDESGTHDQSEVVAVVGYLATYEGWSHWEIEWNEVMTHYGVTDFHMTDFVARRGEFSDEIWTDERRTAFMKRITTICRERTMMGLGCAVKRADYERCLTQTIQDDLRHPYYFCLYACFNMLLHWSSEHIDAIKPVQFLFDRKPGRFRIGSHMIGWEAFATELFYRLKAGLDEEGAVVGDMAFGSRHDYPQLRAADLLVFEASRILLHASPLDDADWRESMKALSSRKNMLIAFPDESKMRNFVTIIEAAIDGASAEDIRRLLRRENF
jgi:hypothetical protein